MRRATLAIWLVASVLCARVPVLRAAEAAVKPGGDPVTVLPPSEEMLKIRDPFKRPEVETGDAGKPKSDLERYPVDAFRMVAVLTGPSRMRAMLLGPDSKTYLVTERMKIGTRGGWIKRITADAVEVRERIVNVLGQEENVDSEIKLVSDSKKQASAGALNQGVGQ